MDWIKSNYERALLGLFAAVLLVCAGLVVWQATSFPGMFSNRKNAKAPDNTVTAPNIKSITDAAALASNPVPWVVHEGSLLVSRPYILMEQVLVDPLESDKDLHPPIKNAWLLKNNLDYSDSSIKEQDPDNDGFTNLEEFVAGSDPSNPNSHPPFYTKLRLLKFDPKPFRLKFSGDSGDNTYTINTLDIKSRTQFLKIGEMIKGAPYKVLAFEKKSTTRNEMETDVSELTIENTDTGQKIVLVFNKEANDPTSFGEFVFLYDNTRFRLKKNEEFSLKPEESKKFKLIDISAQEAQIQDLSTGEKFRIGKAE